MAIGSTATVFSDSASSSKTVTLGCGEVGQVLTEKAFIMACSRRYLGIAHSTEPTRRTT